MDELPKLINTSDNSVITINNSSFSIGRSLSCDHIINSLGISRFHCIIKKNDDKWTLYDRSSNGTVVNHIHYKFNESVDLKSGDVIKLGPENYDYVFITDKPTIIPEPDHIVEVEAIPLEVAEEFQQPFGGEAPPEEPKPATSQNLDIMENELTCSICSELFIKAVTLNCSHTFCKYCINEWRKNKSTCPICRNHVTSVAPTLVLDNYIEKIISTQSHDMKEMRRLLVKQREEVVGSTAGSSVGGDKNQIVEIIESDDEDDDDTDNYSDQDYEDYDEDYYDRPYYGGYGRCFVCNQRGHWANSCPYKNR